MFIKRDLLEELIDYAREFPVIAILGPRQSGKTTLAQETFPSYAFVSLEDADKRFFAQNDARGFLEEHRNEHGIIIDEVHRVPDLLSYIQTVVDKEKLMGKFILTGSQNFLLNETITQTLAGRIALMTLMPFSTNELARHGVLPDKIESLIFKGSYPRLYAHASRPERWYAQYIKTYVERDVRQIKNITDLTNFQLFMKMCAGRIGQVVNLSSLASDCGISTNTAKSWLSVLQASYVIFLLESHHKNFSKRLIKAPKIYFYDTGLACSLLGIESEEQLLTHYLRGGLVEQYVLADLFKQAYNAGRTPHIYFWRDSFGHELDCIIEQADTLIPIEIKSGKTITAEYFKGLAYWCQLSQTDPANGYVIYTGTDDSKRSMGNVLTWQSAGTLLNKLRRK